MSEVRETSRTGGEKGSKGTAFRNIPMDFLLELGRHYGDGETKYPSDPDGLPNFWKGYDIGLNIEALLRHLFAWIGGEDDIPDDGTDDPTAGNNHLMAVVWHAIDCWRKQNTEWDTRPAVALANRERQLTEEEEFLKHLQRFSVWKATPIEPTEPNGDRAMAEEMDHVRRDYDRGLASGVGYDFYLHEDGTVEPLSARARGWYRLGGPLG